MSENFENKINAQHEKQKAEYKVTFKTLRNYLDDLPPNNLELEDPNYDIYKCRTTYFASVRMNIELAIDEDIILDPGLKKELIDYLKELEEVDWKARRVREDIDKVNNILDDLIKYLEG